MESQQLNRLAVSAQRNTALTQSEAELFQKGSPCLWFNDETMNAGHATWCYGKRKCDATQ